MNQDFTLKIAVIDVDGTLIEGQIQQALINFFRQKGDLGFWYVLCLNLWFLAYKIHMTKNVRNVFEFGLRYLKNKPVELIIPVINKFVQTRLKDRAFKKSFGLIRELRARGYTIILLSTAVDVVINEVAKMFDADDYICTRLEIRSGHYTGRILGKILYGQAKADALKEYLNGKPYSLSECEAYADHESDIPLLKIVGKAYVVNPNTHMKRIANREGLAIMETR